MAAIRGAIVYAVTAVLLAHAPAFGQSAKGAIRGQVLDSNGLPAMNARVIALELPDAKGLSASDPVSVGTTDAEGRYRLTDIPTGRYGVFTNIRSAHDVREQDLNAAPIVTVRSGKDSIRDIYLSPVSRGVTVSGRFHRDRASKELEVLLGRENLYLRSKIAVDGTFAFRNVSPGTYRMAVSVAQFAWGAQEIRVEERDITGIELFPDDSIPVTGRVITEGNGPVPAFSFSLEGSEGSALSNYIWVMDTLRSTGMVGVTGWTDRPDDVIFNASLPIGEYRIAVTGLPPGYRVKSFMYGSTNVLEQPLKLTGAIDQLSIVLSPPETLHSVKISGRLIRDVAFRPDLESDSFILNSLQLLIPLETVIARDGSFEISGVPPGVYDVSSPRAGLRLAVGNADVRGLELRTSEIQSRWDAAVRMASKPPERPAEIVAEVSMPESPVTAEPADPKPVELAQVGGRVSGMRDAAVLEATQVVLDGENLFTADLDSEGRFAFPAIPFGIYSLYTSHNGNSASSQSYAKRVVVRDADLEGIEVRDVPPMKQIIGRIVVAGGNPFPGIALTVRPNVDSGPPFLHPYTLLPSPSLADPFRVQSDGRFTLDLPEGLHRLRVDGLTNYRVKSVTYGSVNLNDGLLRIDGANLKELILTLTAGPSASVTTVKGKVEGMANWSAGVRVMLSGNRSGLHLEAVPNPDGTFQFAKVPADSYSIRFMPKLAATSSKTIAVTGRDVPLVLLAIPAQQDVALRIATDNGALPPNLSLKLTLSQTEAYTILLFASFVMRSADEFVCTGDVCHPSREATVGGPTVVAASKSDGRYTLRMPEGEYRVDLLIPVGYELTSVVAGESDLRQAPLRVGPGASDEVVVNLRKK